MFEVWLISRQVVRNYCGICCIIRVGCVYPSIGKEKYRTLISLESLSRQRVSEEITFLDEEFTCGIYIYSILGYVLQLYSMHHVCI